MKRVDEEQWRAKEVARLLALVEAERRYYQEIIAVMPVGLAVFDADLAFVSANHSFRRVFGIAEKDLSKLRLEDLFPGEEVSRRIREVLDSGKPQIGVVVESTGAEGPRNLQLSMQPFHGWNTEAESEVLLIIHNPDSGAGMREPSAADDERQRVENLDALIWERDAKSLRFLYAVGRSEEILGFPAAAWTADETFYDHRIHPEDRDWVLAFYRASLSSTGSRSCEYRAVAADSHPVWLRDVIRVIRDKEGAPLRLRGITVDITAQKFREEERVQSGKMAALGRLAGKVSHDCNNLLMILTGYGEELLANLPEDHPSHGDVEEILAATERLSVVTAELLRFTQRPTLVPKGFSLNTLIESLEPDIRREIGPAVALHLRLAKDLGPVHADWDRMGEVILTFARQARQVMPDGGRWTIETAHKHLVGQSSRPGESLTPRRYATITMTDSGPELDETAKARLFEPLFLSGRSGQDLSPAYVVIRDSGGDIRTATGPEGGTRYTIFLPLVEGAEGTPPAPDAGLLPEEARAEPKATVLLAEDESGIRTLVRKILRKQGYTVLEAENGERAAEIAAAHSGAIHLLLTDVVMPGVNGAELAERLRSSRPDLKVLYISGYTGDELASARSLPEGSMFLQKPFSLTALIDKVRAVLAA